MSARLNDGQGGAVLVGLDAFLDRDLISVATELEAFVEMLTRWQKVQNLVSRETLSNLWVRHMRDSLQLVRGVRARDCTILDLGSGGGFPAIPLAIALKESGRSFHLVESNKRKASFLRTVARELDLPVQVHGKRMEQLTRGEIGEIDLITCRATAPLVTILSLVEPFWSEQTRGLFHKGREYGEELVKARADWRFSVIELPSETDRDSRILEISGLQAGS